MTMTLVTLRGLIASRFSFRYHTLLSGSLSAPTLPSSVAAGNGEIGTLSLGKSGRVGGRVGGIVYGVFVRVFYSRTGTDKTQSETPVSPVHGLTHTHIKQAVCVRDNMHAYLWPSSFISDKKVLVSLFGVEPHGAPGHACSIIS